MHVLVTSIIDLEKTPYSRLHRFIEHLLGCGHRVTVISIKDFWKHKGVRQNKDLIDRIDIHYITKREMGIIIQKGSALFRMPAILNKIDLETVDVHLAYNSLILFSMVKSPLSRHGIKTVYDIADDLPDMIRTSPQVPFLLRPFAGAFAKMLLRRNMHRAACITYSAREFLKSLGIRHHKNTYVPNGVDLERFRPKGFMHKGIVLGYVGALREWVDLRPMLHAALLHRDSGLRVLIVGGEEDLPRYKRFTEELHMGDMVRFTGNVPYPDVPNYINSMDITTVPFRKNRVTDGTCPLKLLEYMACGKPAIVSDLNEVHHMLADRVLYASSVDDWEREIGRLIEDPSLRERLGREGREHVAKHFNWSSICSTMESVLKDNCRR